MIAELCSLTNRDAMLRSSRSYMPALVEALQHLNKNPE